MRRIIVPILLILMAGRPIIAAETTAPNNTGITTDQHATEAAQIRTILTEAESLGMPSLAGATFHVGMLMLPSAKDFVRVNTKNYASSAFHAHFPDGRWLVHLSIPMVAESLSASDLATLKPVDLTQASVKKSCLTRDPSAGLTQGADAIGVLRWMSLGMPDAWERLQEALGDSFRGYSADSNLYPKIPSHLSVEMFAHLACRDWFLTRLSDDPTNGRWATAALTMAPTEWKDVTRDTVSALQTPTPPEIPNERTVARLLANRPSGYASQVYADWTKVCAKLSEAELVAAVNDLSALAKPKLVNGFITETVSDRALVVLYERWGFDPLLLIGGADESLWNPTTRRSAMARFTAWATATAGKPFAERLPLAIAALTTSQLLDLSLALRDRVTNTNGGITHGAAITDAETCITVTCQALASRWQQPPDLLPEQLRNALVRLGQVPEIAAAVARWPRSGPLATVLAEWDDFNLHHAGVDALVERWLADPDGWSDYLPATNGREVEYWNGRRFPVDLPTQSARHSPLGWWVVNATPDRWGRIQSIAAGDLTQPTTRALIAAIGALWTDFTWLANGNHHTCAHALMWLGLTDQRQLSPALRSLAMTRWEIIQQQPLWKPDPSQTSGFYFPWRPLIHHLPESAFDDLRVCDVVAMHLTTNTDWLQSTYGFQHQAVVATWSLGSPRAQRDVWIAALRRRVTEDAAKELTSLKIPLPTSLISAVEAQATITRGISDRERTIVMTAYQEARTLGLPDLAGATLHTGYLVETGSQSPEQLHVQLADQTWLINGVWPTATIPRNRATPMPWELQPNMDGVSFAKLPDEDAARVEGVSLGDHELSRKDNPLLLMLIPWLTASSEQINVASRRLLRAIYLTQMWDFERIGCVPVPGEFSSERPQNWPGITTTPDLGRCVRRGFARWFHDRAIVAMDAHQERSEVERWINACPTIVAAPDRSAWEIIAKRLRERATLDATSSQAASLEDRLATWTGGTLDPKSGRMDSSSVPTTKSAELIPLLNNQRTCRWTAEGHLCFISDLALYLLTDLWQVDPRWLVVDDPRVAALLPAPDRIDPSHEG